MKKQVKTPQGILNQHSDPVEIPHKSSVITKELISILVGFWVLVILMVVEIQRNGTGTLGDLIMRVAVIGGGALVIFLVLQELITSFFPNEVNTSKEENKEKLAGLLKNEEEFDSQLSRSADATVLLNKDGLLDYASLGLNRVLGWRLDRATGKQFLDLVYVDDRKSFEGAMEVILQRKGRTASLDARIKADRGEWKSCEITLTNLLEVKKFSSIILNIREVDTRKRLEQELRFKTLQDPLTTLPSRAIFIERLAQVRDGEGAGIFLIDVDDFKAINDSLGYETGDLLLTQIANRLLQFIGPQDTLSRLSGDEFAILTKGIQHMTQGEVFVRQLVRHLHDPLFVQDREVRLRVSVGVALESLGNTNRELLRYAELALHQAKHSGKHRFEFFHEEMEEDAIRRMEVESELTVAIEKKELELYYQPIVDLKNRELLGFEALVRWQHPTKGLILPGEFIPVAERSGLILGLGDWVLQAAAEQLQKWRENTEMGSKITLSLNVSAWQLDQADFVDRVKEVVDGCMLPPGSLVLELTESVFIDGFSEISRKLKLLQRLGIPLSLDDFGTGYSSLSYLRNMPVSVLKIDRSFVIDIARDPKVTAMVRAIMGLAQILGMTVVAEGIEDEKQMEILRELGCNKGQGYLFAKPLPIAEANKLMLGQKI